MMSASAVFGFHIPDHVPADLVWDHDFNDFCRELDDPFLAAGRLLDESPILWGRSVFFGRPAWILTRHALMEEAFLSPEIFSNKRVMSEERSGMRMIPVELDPPEHGKYRRLLQAYFSPRSIRTMEGTVKATCDELIDGLANRGGCEFIHDFAARLPNMVFLSMMGMPLDMLDQFLAWEKSLIHADSDEVRANAARAIMGYLKGFIDEQREAPTTELMRVLLNARIDDAPLNDLDLLGTCFLLYVGGLDTVYSSLGWIFRHLAGDQLLQRRLRENPLDIPAAVDEFARAFPVARPSRTVVRDCTFHGVAMRQGEYVIVPTYIAGRDPAAYPDPHRIDIDRNARNITFATGPHTCLGVFLAKREITIVLESFLARFRNIRMPAGAGYEYHVGGVFGVDRLPLEWDADTIADGAGQ